MENQMAKKGIYGMLLEKGYLLEFSLMPLFKQIDSSIQEHILNALLPLFPASKKIISERDFIINLEKINNILNNIKSKLDEEQKEEIEKTIELFSEFQKNHLINPVEEIKLPVKSEEEPENKEKIGGLEEEKVEEEINLPEKGFFIKNYHVPSKKFTVEDFALHFKNRFNTVKEIIQNKGVLTELVSISKLSGQRQKVNIIGMVFEKRRTKNKNIILRIEDLTGQVPVVVSQSNQELFNIAENIVEDDILGIKGFGTSEILFATDILFPDISIIKKQAEKEEYAVFISDVHVGSKMFLEQHFSNFINWLNLKEGSETQKELAKKVKYLFIVGDTVEGVGVFPGQEKLVIIPDLKDQYSRLAEFLISLREEINVFICPGQHDASRLAEPQPPISPVYAQGLYNKNNIFLVSNPAMITIGKTKNFQGFKILMYHGASFSNIVNELDELRIARAHDNPTRVVKTLLKRRHLSPSHSFTTYLPAVKDSLLIYEAPDIIATGDFHKAEVSNYNNILLIASSCWQTTTPFEEKVGNHPDPCKVPVFNLKTGQVKIMDFT